ncbi:MAG: hypothetical protein ACYC2U_06680, partial [Candidatus Amoebophilus sp.]
MNDVNQKDHLAMLNESSNEAVVPTEKNRSRAKYFSIPFAAFLVLYLFTGSYFKIYWLYYNWRAIRSAEKPDISPFWRSIFAVFFMDEFFQNIFDSAKMKGYTGFTKYRLLNGYYATFLILSWTFYFLAAFSARFILYNNLGGSELASAIILLFYVLGSVFLVLKILCFWHVQ